MVMLSVILWWSQSVCARRGHEWIQPGEAAQGWSWDGGGGGGLVGVPGWAEGFL